MCIERLDKYSDWGPLVLRVVVGLIFLLSGWGKVTGIAGVAGFFASMGFPAASVLAWIVAIVELVGGIMLILGVLTRWAAIPLAAIMAVALFTAKWGSWTSGGRLDLSLLASLVALVLLGGGKCSLLPEGRLCKNKRRK